MSKWRVEDCFSGASCWCGCIFDPDGNEVVGYGEVSREACHVIVDAMNGACDNTRSYNEVFKRYPLPWHAQEVDRGHYVVVTTQGLTTDRVEDAIACAGAMNEAHAKLFVEKVNSFYMPA